MCKTWLEWLSHQHRLALAIVNKCIYFILFSLYISLNVIRMYVWYETYFSIYKMCVALNEMICTFCTIFERCVSCILIQFLLLCWITVHFNAPLIRNQFDKGTLWTTILQDGHCILREIYIYKCQTHTNIEQWKKEMQKMPENVCFSPSSSME